MKSLPGFLCLLVMTLVLALLWRRESRGMPVIPAEWAAQWRTLWVSLLVFTGACMVGTMDISIRHFSVPLVLLILLMAPLPRLIAAAGKARWHGRLGW